MSSEQQIALASENKHGKETTPNRIRNQTLWAASAFCHSKLRGSLDRLAPLHCFEVARETTIPHMLAPVSSQRCSRCDKLGHVASSCQYFPFARSEHADAWTHLDQPPVREADDGNCVVLRGASVLRQSKDGHCLFHSLAEGVSGVGEEVSGEALRVELVEWLRGQREATHNGCTFAE